ncbi:hypothetical protein OsI_36453 [Oryza sativa Indica Group]|uniref:Uncharacterized protein n=1 Tax=Oryza sativa subsp. indica TaxID=39946 RepID=B8BL03_ORYSI|nr:hypothetical protein OsI_36453 [Oryza sativa Indica Group]
MDCSSSYSEPSDQPESDSLPLTPRSGPWASPPHGAAGHGAQSVAWAARAKPAKEVATAWTPRPIGGPSSHHSGSTPVSILQPFANLGPKLNEVAMFEYDDSDNDKSYFLRFSGQMSRCCSVVTASMS